MKAEELMIGDWVLGLVEDNEEIGKIIAKHPARIIKIEENGDYAAQCPYTFDEMYEGDGTLIEDFLWYDTEPMPLTAEILEKNGWKYNPTIKAYEWQHEAFYISINMDEKTRIYVVNDYIFGMALGAVHELQHALRLCGINKEIVL